MLEASGLLNGRYDTGGKITENRGEELFVFLDVFAGTLIFKMTRSIS